MGKNKKAHIGSADQIAGWSYWIIPGVKDKPYLSPGRKHTVADVLAVVGLCYGYDPKEILAMRGQGKSTVVRPRMIAIYILIEYANWYIRDLTPFFGLDETSLKYSRNIIRVRSRTDDQLAAELLWCLNHL